MSKAKFVKEIVVTDPDSQAPVELAVFKHEGGGMFALDSSYIDQVLPDEGTVSILDPFVDNPSTNMDDNFVELEGV